MSLTVVSQDSTDSHGSGDSPSEDIFLDSGREFIRHPAQVPIKVSSDKNPNQMNLRLHNVSAGGLSFESPNPFSEGAVVTIKIPTRPVFQVHAVVQWCKALKECFELGVKFLDQGDAYRVRMVEQVCYIEEYRLKKQAERGKRMTRNQASLEWIRQHGGRFPRT